MLSIYRLPNKLPNEKVIRVLRRDYFILFKKIAFFTLLFVLPWIFFRIMISAYPGLLYSSLSYSLIVLGGSAFYLFIWVFFFFSFIDYYLDVWIITNERIIDVRQEGFFSRTISENRLPRIQDVSSEVHGFFPTVLKYGDVYVQTAGAELKFRFHEVPNPDRTRDTIIKLTEECKLRHARTGNKKQVTNNK
jgi:uncharacterized membrane protein YdbT with pleckstrin-like domain